MHADQKADTGMVIVQPEGLVELILKLSCYSFLLFTLVTFLCPPVDFRKARRNSPPVGNSPFLSDMIVSNCQI